MEQGQDLVTRQESPNDNDFIADSLPKLSKIQTGR